MMYFNALCICDTSLKDLQFINKKTIKPKFKHIMPFSLLALTILALDFQIYKV